MQKQEIEQTEKDGILALEGEMTISFANELKEKLICAMSRVNHIKLDLTKTTETDLSFLQLLYAVHQASVKANKRLTIIKCSRPFKNAVINAGYTTDQGCILECENDCFSGKGEI
ncbi:MAG: STAS domain-containing protein [Candidatus Kuenenia sp.]|nr:STAS domain-containing protein [Candidatus Kuenenia hertensis]